MDEDCQLQEAIELSKMENDAKSSTLFDDQLRERSARMKRKAEGELDTPSAKRQPPARVSSSRSSDPTPLIKAPGESVIALLLFHQELTSSS
jgi:tyrosyl-DNA phosphodiesterase-1